MHQREEPPRWIDEVARDVVDASMTVHTKLGRDFLNRLTKHVSRMR